MTRPASGTPRLSVILPTLNEAANLPGLLTQLRAQQGIALQIIVADGGSTDATREIAEHQGAEWLEGPAGRALQMNLGATRARADWLLFLHADSGLSDPGQLARALAALRATRQQLGHERVAGHFRLRFQRTRPGHDLAYHYYQEKSALNRPECTNGDQGLLLSRAFFRQLGGFDESLWFLEDQRLAETIRRLGVWITLPGELLTSARRFEQEGLGRRMVLSALIMNFHAMGWREFFERASDLYRNQDQTARLQLKPIFRLIDQLNRETGRKVSRQRWLATGRYVLGHAWQPAFFLDVALAYRWGLRRRLFLPLHERLFEPLCGLRPLHYVTAALTWLWFRAYGRWLDE